MKKGFTLIELLAVIVILAIIAVIAVPIVLNIIDESKENATLRSAEMYLKAVDYAIARSTLKGQNIEDKTYNILENGNICLEDYVLENEKYVCKDKDGNDKNNELIVEVKGETPKEGTIVIEGSKVVNKSNKGDKTQLIINNQEIIIKPNGQLSYPEPICKKVTGDDLNYKYVYYDDGANEHLLGQATYTTGTKSVGDAYRCQVNDEDSYIFNIIGQDVSGNYNLLLNHNIGLVSDGSPETVATTLFTLTGNWTNIPVRTDSYSGEYFMPEESTYNQYTFNYSGHYARLIEYSELEKFAGSDVSPKPTWISSVPKDRQTAEYNDWAYISSSLYAFDTMDVSWNYYGLACGVYACTSPMEGIRPVITVASSDIE